VESSPVSRRIVFAVLVCALVGLGAYLIGPVAHGSGRGSGHASASASSAAAAPPAGVTSPTPAVSAASASGSPDIYQWLPFSQAGLAAAASVVVRFGNSYGTYSYTQSAAEYVAPLQAIATGQLTQQIEAAFSAPGVASARTGGKQVSAGTTTIESIRAFGPTSLTFVAQVDQQLTGSAGRSVQDTVYAITVIGSGTSWQVSDVELASLGNS
jgi:uncharacterized protein (DUF697 family)